MSYSPSELLGLQVVAGKPVNIYSSIYGEPILTAPTGSPLGTLFSYVVRDNVFWWQLDNSTYGNFYVKNSPGVFNNVYFEAQGALTNEQLIEQAEQENQGIADILIGGGVEIAKLGLLALVVFLAIKYSSNEKK